MKTWSIHSSWLIVPHCQPGQVLQAWAHALQAAACWGFFFSLFVFFPYVLRFHAPWPHQRNWQGTELSLNINCTSQVLSVRTVTAISCFAFPNTLHVRNLTDVSQQLWRGEPDSQAAVRAVYYFTITGGVLWELWAELKKHMEERQRKKSKVTVGRKEPKPPHRDQSPNSKVISTWSLNTLRHWFSTRYSQIFIMCAVKSVASSWHEFAYEFKIPVFLWRHSRISTVCTDRTPLIKHLPWTMTTTTTKTCKTQHVVLKRKTPVQRYWLSLCHLPCCMVITLCAVCYGSHSLLTSEIKLN